MVLPSFFPAALIRGLRVRKGRRTQRGGGSPPPDPDPFKQQRVLEKSRELVQTIRWKSEPRLQVPQTRSAWGWVLIMDYHSLTDADKRMARYIGRRCVQPYNNWKLREA